MVKYLFVGVLIQILFKTFPSNGPFAFGNCTKDLSPWEEAVTRMSVKLQLQRTHQANLQTLKGQRITTFHWAIIFYPSLLRNKLARLYQRAN